MTIIAADTFALETSEVLSFGTVERGTVECTLRGETRRVRSTRWPDGKLTAYGFVGRYRSGTTQWPANVAQYNKGEIVSFGRDDRDPKFRKENNIWFKK